MSEAVAFALGGPVTAPAPFAVGERPSARALVSAVGRMAIQGVDTIDDLHRRAGEFETVVLTSTCPLERTVASAIAADLTRQARTASLTAWRL
ncbi:hypothetical protein [Methylobacterium nodulans]|uniref:Uncharacterized protein n=1 Tax=Methylobacterium nodulans (strain LMG 21967 / CNCM I-2342 / ORS 2060) TaxID=460265 RepID=B8ILV4_METNO|nr:hypothetical protein [Methylobacterium nodulans]ACL62079.1 hypothetical protein Mnod_7340 [Methylobacterium nodulans ORS 2060]